MPGLKLIPADQVINEAINLMPSYFETGVVDESVVYSAIEKVNSVVGIRMRNINSVVLPIENYKAKLPEDFYKLCYAVLCSDYTIELPELRGSYVKEERIKNSCELKPCEVPLKDDCGYYRAIQKFPTYTIEASSFTPVMISETSRSKCASDCPNVFKKNPNGEPSIQLTNTEIISEIKEGYLMIEYYEDFKELMIVDHPRIITWAKEEIIYAALKKAYLNGDDDAIARKLQFQARECHNAEVNARNVLKPEIQDFYDMSNGFLDRFNFLRNVVTRVRPARTWTP